MEGMWLGRKFACSAKSSLSMGLAATMAAKTTSNGSHSVRQNGIFALDCAHDHAQPHNNVARIFGFAVCFDFCGEFGVRSGAASAGYARAVIKTGAAG